MKALVQLAWLLALTCGMTVAVEAAPVAVEATPSPVEPTPSPGRGADIAPSVQPDWRAEVTVPWVYPTGNTPVVITIRARKPVELTLTANYYRASSTEQVSLGAGVHRYTLLMPPVLAEDDYGSVKLRISDGDEAVVIHESMNNRKVGALLIARDSQHLTKVQNGVHHRHELGQAIQLTPSQVPALWQAFPLSMVVVVTADGWQGLTQQQQSTMKQLYDMGYPLMPLDAAASAVLAQADMMFDSDEIATGHNDIRRLSDAMINIIEPEDRPVPGTESVPTGPFIFIAVVVAVVAGPLNLLWCRRRRRELLLLTTPALGFGASVVLIAVALLSQGITVKRSGSGAYMLFDGTLTYAVAMSYFAPLPPPEFTIPSDAALCLHKKEDFGYLHHHRHWRWRRELTTRAGLGLQRDGATRRASGPWIPSQLHQQLLLTGQQRERSQLPMVIPADGKPVLTNGLTVAIRAVAWRDGDGEMWYGRDIAPGQQAVLSQVKSWPKLKHPKPLARHFNPAIARRWREVVRQPYVADMILAGPLLPLWGPSANDITDDRSYYMLAEVRPGSQVSVTVPVTAPVTELGRTEAAP